MADAVGTDRGALRGCGGGVSLFAGDGDGVAGGGSAHDAAFAALGRADRLLLP